MMPFEVPQRVFGVFPFTFFTTNSARSKQTSALDWGEHAKSRLGEERRLVRSALKRGRQTLEMMRTDQIPLLHLSMSGTLGTP